MSLINAFKDWKNVSGRARRLEFGQVFVFSFIVFILISFVSMYIFVELTESFKKDFSSQESVSNILAQGLTEYFYSGSINNTLNATDQYYQDSMMQNWITSLLIFILFLPFLVVLISCAVRLLHDIGTFGWWIVIVTVPLWLFFDLWIVTAPMIFLIFKDGQRHYNKYGADPKNPDAPIPLEMPKENQSLKNFETKVLVVVDKIRKALQPHLDNIKSKLNNKEK
ncbi:DUF805 domain-containing protein [Rodentibacter trehalosifermentans]|uniref:DUF805 domain-containing protein n=1 Tax=Rodentibacter trehalosifermentans TaxID=1908263 RepID=UPI000986DDF9|nr:DUF805 domain-containing protein [Rodentibacter trehalosifermentans]OOF45955.1 hypothetical protein BKK53_12070 [Rodentibacter trehalosifermentans]